MLRQKGAQYAHVATVIVGVLLAVTSGIQAAEPSLTLPLSGTDWRIHEDAGGQGVEQRLFEADPALSGWLPATVPGNIQADLEAAHLLKPISYGAGDPELAKVAAKDWWYRKDFVVPAAMAGRRLTLIFDGVDQQCDIWVNGQRVGSNTGMFKRFWFDVTALGRPGDVNRLAVRIARDPRIWSWITGDQIRKLKAPTNGGWDWNTPISTLGIWKDVRLEATGPARIAWTRVRTELSEDHSRAKVVASLEVDCTAEVPVNARFRVSGQGCDIEISERTALRKGTNIVETTLPLQQPALWWPNGQGEQPLYTLTSELQPANGGVPLDRRTTRFGVRDIRWIHTEGASTNFISRYQLLINGRPVRTMGSNMIPVDQLFGRMHTQALMRLRQARDAGMNTLRLWGGGVIFNDAFYDLADELGILLSQEFPLANQQPPADEEYLAMLEANARNIVRQVRNHPSIMEYSGGNEMAWNSYSKHPALELLKRIVGEDDGRLCRATCPDLGASHGPWNFDWWAGGPHFDTVLNSMRAGEFGSASPAHLEVWQREVPPKDQWPILGVHNPVLARKKAVWAVFAGAYWLQQNEIEELFGAFDALDDLITAGQFYGAEGLRYEVDALRRKGRRISGMTTWDFNEPWPNCAGSYQVDYDGRPLMNYAFMKQALAPLSLSLKYDAAFYPLEKGLTAGLFLASDAPAPSEGLRWRWLARDRRGTVFAHDKGRASIAPLEVKSLGLLQLKPPAPTVFGPFFVELRLEDVHGKLLTERLHVFAAANQRHPFGQLVRRHNADSDDDASQVKATVERPTDPANVLWGLFAKTAKTPSTGAESEQYSVRLAVNDGFYGNDRAWSESWFQMKLKEQTTLGRFKYGRDRTGICTNNCADYVKIETSLDGATWQTVFEQDKLTQLPGFSPVSTVEIRIAPVAARYLKVSLRPLTLNGKPVFPVLDEFEAYAPATNTPATLPQAVALTQPDLSRPLRRTTLSVRAVPMRVENGQEVLELRVKNTGPMTAFPCEAHPLISYRTDLFIDNNHCFIPPGESRVITVRGPRAEGGGRRAEGGGQTAEELTLAQTGWWISCWNADRVEVAPDESVLLAVGRRDRMCWEFRQTESGIQEPGIRSQELEGSKPDPAKLLYRLDGGSTACFEFPVSRAQSKGPARLRLHTADQSKEVGAVVQVTVNGKTFEQTLPTGLGLQKSDPAHLAYPATAEFELPAGSLRWGKNVIEVQVQNAGWFTWDSLECVAGGAFGR